MKRAFLFFAVLFSLAPALSPVCRAEDYIEKYKEYADDGRSVSVTEFLTGAEEDGEDELESFLDSLPEDVRDMLPEGIGGADPAAASDAFGVKFFVDLIFDVLGKTVKKIIPAFGALAAVVVVIFIMKTVSEGGAVSKTATGVMHACLCVAAAASGVISFTTVSEYLKILSAVSSACVPLFVGMLVATGNVTSAGASAAFISALSDICERVFAGVVLPMTGASASLSFAESVFSESSRFALSSLVRKAAVWITVSVSSVASFIFGVQSLLSGAADTAGLKTVKFAVGSFVPFVGGALGDTVSFLAAGAKSVKSVAGVILLVILFALMLSPLVTLVAGKAALAVLSALCGVLGLASSAKLFEDLSSAVSCLIALTVSAGVIFLVAVLAFISYGGTI